MFQEVVIPTFLVGVMLLFEFTVAWIICARARLSVQDPRFLQNSWTFIGFMALVALLVEHVVLFVTTVVVLAAFAYLGLILKPTMAQMQMFFLIPLFGAYLQMALSFPWRGSKLSVSSRT
ncbi:MAG: hypothetical protein NUV56_04980 [Candidatus Uhrbacteria bacterium]|nr:hypothetical protein [Candidatus Uhrbacteria bacterium]